VCYNSITTYREEITMSHPHGTDQCYCYPNYEGECGWCQRQEDLAQREEMEAEEIPSFPEEDEYELSMQAMVEEMSEIYG
jgi:hypothetical protein